MGLFFCVPGTIEMSYSEGSHRHTQKAGDIETGRRLQEEYSNHHEGFTFHTQPNNLPMKQKFTLMNVAV
jgi:hypothetical protein